MSEMIQKVRGIVVYFTKNALTLFLLGIGAGLPLPLILGTLTLWLNEAGLEKSMVTMFSWAALGYSFKFVWAPLINTLSLPVLTDALGHRRSWILIAQLCIIASIALMASLNPANPSALSVLALGSVLLGFSSATQDIVIDAYRIESAPTNEQTALAATYVAGYRVGMIVSGAGALFLASYFGSTQETYRYEAWRATYFIMAGVMSALALVTVFYAKKDATRPLGNAQKYGQIFGLFLASVMVFVALFIQLGAALPTPDGLLFAFLVECMRFLGALAVSGVVALGLTYTGIVDKSVCEQLWISPVADFFERYGKKAALLLALIGLYRVSDIVAGTIANVFYQDMGYTKEAIATAGKLFGLLATIFGGFLGGTLATKLPLMRIMSLGALLACASNLFFIALYYMPQNLGMLYLVVGADNLAGGLASAVFVAFLSALTSVRFTAVQYALFSSLMTLFPKVLGGYSGALVEHTSYPVFFAFTFFLGLPILYLIHQTQKHISLKVPT